MELAIVVQTKCPVLGAATTSLKLSTARSPVPCVATLVTTADHNFCPQSQLLTGYGSDSIPV